ncbi:MAG: HU family DNA-binding protein [Methylococcaceae bacterium]|nr:MAG: HU family DNA-binding protein [Methylococcaceae bacterium]
MKQSELIDCIVAANHNAAQSLNKSHAAALLGRLAVVITAALADGDEVTLPHLGKFTIKERAARQGRNPATGEAITIPAGRAVVFKPVKALKDAVGWRNDA